ncbi:MAG: branched-chain amino acid ABC transporter permease [Actinomycetota bacterium]|nr:branched-chain amino acid ABC transporter permease [Actinomycetota bacterium]
MSESAFAVRRLFAAAGLGLSALLLFAAPGMAQETTGPAIGVTVRDPDGETVEGVDIEVRQDGTVIDSATTGADGRVVIALPEPNTSYEVELDTDTLPEGLSVRDGQSALDEVGVRGGLKPVIFPLVEGDGGGASGPVAWEKIVDLAADGVRLGLILAVASVGLSLIFGVTGLTNFAHGELVTFGALIAYMLSVSLLDIPLILAGLLAVVAGAAMGWANERALFRPLRARKTGNVSLIVVTIGLGIFLRNLYLIIFNGGPRPFQEYTIQENIEFGPISLRAKDFASMAICVVVLLLVALVLQRTRLGTAMRAVSDDKDLARASGIDVERIIGVTWTGAGALAALGGVLQGIGDTVQWDMGFTLLLLMFAAVILGGLGTAYGPIVGGIIIGVTSQVSTYWISTKYRVAVALVVLIIAVMIRPQGILGRKERIG